MIKSDGANMLTIAQLARAVRLCRQAIYIAIKLGKIKAEKREGKWRIKVADFVEYHKGRYSRTKTKYNGELVYDNDKGRYSVGQASKYTKIEVQRLYYLIHTKRIPYTMYNKAYILHVEDLDKLKKLEKGNRKRK